MHLISEIKGNLFDAPLDYALAQCISEDCAMGITSKGGRFPCIALQFRDRFPKMPEYCLKQRPTVRDSILYADTWNIFNLVTKHDYFGKPSMNTIKLALESLKVGLIDNNLTKLAIPRLGSGADRLDWNQVKGTIINIFEDTDIEITVYTP
jgi:hypothetical protein